MIANTSAITDIAVMLTKPEISKGLSIIIGQAPLINPHTSKTNDDINNFVESFIYL